MFTEDMMKSILAPFFLKQGVYSTLDFMCVICQYTDAVHYCYVCIGVPVHCRCITSSKNSFAMSISDKSSTILKPIFLRLQKVSSVIMMVLISASTVYCDGYSLCNCKL